MLGHIVEDHLPRYRSDELQAGEKPVVGKLILTRNTVSTMGLNDPVEAENYRLGSGPVWRRCWLPRRRVRRRETSGALHVSWARSSLICPRPRGGRSPGVSRSGLTTRFARSRAYAVAFAMAKRAIPTETAARECVQGFSPSNAAAALDHSFSSPTKLSTGTRTSLKKGIELLLRFLRAVSIGWRVGTGESGRPSAAIVGRDRSRSGRCGSRQGCGRTRQPRRCSTSDR